MSIRSSRERQKSQKRSETVSFCPKCSQKAESFEENGHFKSVECNQCEIAYHGCCLETGEGEMAFLCLITGTSWSCGRCQSNASRKPRLLEDDSDVWSYNAGESSNRWKNDDDDDAAVSAKNSSAKSGTIPSLSSSSGGHISTRTDESLTFCSIHEKDREKCLVVTMVPPNKFRSDRQLFLELCRDHFDFVPKVKSVRRMGLTKFKEDRHRPLEIILDSADDAKKIIGLSNRLKTAEDSYIRRNIYINEYLDTRELQKTLRERKKRRDKTVSGSSFRSGESDDVAGHTDDEDANSIRNDTNDASANQTATRERSREGSTLTLRGNEPKLAVDLVTFPSFTQH